MSSAMTSPAEEAPDTREPAHVAVYSMQLASNVLQAVGNKDVGQLTDEITGWIEHASKVAQCHAIESWRVAKTPQEFLGDFLVSVDYRVLAADHVAIRVRAFPW